MLVNSYVTPMPGSSTSLPSMALAPLGLGVPALPTGRLAALTATAPGPACRRAAAVALHLRRAVLSGPAIGQRGCVVVNSLGTQRRCRFTSGGGAAPPLLRAGRGGGGELRQALRLGDRSDLLRRYRLDRDVEQEADGLFFEAVQHPGEHVETLTLVLDQRVALRHRAQADALLEVVHLVEVLTPFAVDDVQQDVTFQLTHRALTGQLLELGFPRGIGTIGIRDQRVEQLLAGQLAGLPDRLGVDQSAVVEADRVQRFQRLPELLQIPVLGVALGGGAIDVSGDHVDEHLVRLLLEALAFQDP